MATGSELFAGDGEMAARCRALDWSATSLGPVDSWPAALQTAVRAVLEAPLPMAVWSGHDLIAIYNDAYRQLLGERHPAALARPYREVWGDIWTDTSPLFERIGKGGAPIFAQDAPFSLRSGTNQEISADALPNAWFTFSLSPVRDEQGEIVAILNIAVDTTRRVLAEREREAARAEAEAAESRLRDIFVQAPAFMAVLRGPNHVFEYANDAYYQLVGHRELIGRSVIDALPEARGQGFEDALTRVFETGTPYVGRESPITIARQPSQGPEQRYVDFIYYPISDAEGRRTGVVAHGYDVTDHIKLRHEAQRARAEAEHANRAKSQFLANMSHEIRTPINAIVGYADLLDAGIGGPLSETQQRYNDRIRASSEHLLTLVNDVLDLSKVEAGEMRIERRVSSVDAVMNAALQMISPQAKAKDLALRRGSLSERLRFLGDEDRVRQIVLNLLSNAVKFTEPGGEVTLHARVQNDAGEFVSDGSWIVFEVSDTGRGIEGSDVERVFEPFAQSANESPLARTGGTGLGLSISRKLARLMGGDVTVKSEVGVGSTFALRLPRATSASAPAADDEWLRVELPSLARDVSGLGNLGHSLVESAEPLENELVMRLTQDLPRESDPSQLADHAAAYFTTLGKLLINLDSEDADTSARDSEDILSVVTDRHGKQRRRLGWSRPDIEREYTVLHALLDSFLRSEAEPAIIEVDPAIDIVHSVLDRSKHGSLAAFDAADFTGAS